MLITREVEICLNGRNIKHFQNLGYYIPKEIDKYGKNSTPRGTTIIVNTKDLKNNSNVKVDVKCDNNSCNKIIKNLPFKVYNKYIKNGKYYCHNCAIKLFGVEKSKSAKLINSIPFAQCGIDNLGEDFLEKYWDYEKNDVSPWDISYGSKKMVYLFCQEKSYHGSYPIRCNSFTNGARCSYCVSRKVHPLDSLGTLYTQVLDIWSDKNKKSPYEYSPGSNQEVYWKCPEGEHKDYKRKIIESKDANFRCPECQYSKGEEAISNYFMNKGFIKISQEDFDQLIDRDNSKVYFIPQKEFKELIGLGKGLLSYDFYIPKLNLLIEYHGMQHEKYCRGFHKSKKDFEKQLEHDKRKCEYALNNNINLLVIWYWDFDRIEEILEREFYLIKTIK